MKKGTVSIIIIAGNAEKDIKQALESANWADEIVCVLANSTDNSKKIAQRYTDKIVETRDEYGKHYARWRNLGLKNATGSWIFYLDTDEVITDELKDELINIAKAGKGEYRYYVVPRKNHFLGKRVKHGGSYPDYVKRFFKRKELKRWRGRIHEEPIIEGEMGKLKGHLLHFTHQDLTSMLEKTIQWTQMEAKALYENDHPPIVCWRIVRMMLTKFWERIIKQQAWRDGTVGWINSIFEVFNTFIIYARLWEIQQRKKP